MVKIVIESTTTVGMIFTTIDSIPIGKKVLNIYRYSLIVFDCLLLAVYKWNS